MKKLRYLYLGICLIFLTGIFGPQYGAFAEELQGSWAIPDDELSAEQTSATSDTKNDEKDDMTEEETIFENLDPINAVEKNEDGSYTLNIAIMSLNPGYPSQEIGEFFMIEKLPGISNSILLAGLSIVYEHSGTDYVQYVFPEGAEMVGESLLLRQKNSPEVKAAENATDVADIVYSTDMAQGEGKLKFVYDGEIVSSLCWNTSADRASDCYAGFTWRKPSILERNDEAEEVEDLYQHNYVLYVPTYDPTNPGIVFVDAETETIEPKCRTVEFSELYTYFEGTNAEQFIELFNRSEESAMLDGCALKYKNHIYALSGTIEANGFKAIYNKTELGVALTKNPTSTNVLELIDVDETVVDVLTYTSGQKKGVSLAMIGFNSDGSEKWVQTYNLTPGAENIYQQFKTCPIGKVINLETGNCVNETSLTSTLAACPEGKYRNPLTGRCKSYATTASSELKPCAEGYERNPDTGRCRKIVVNDGADYALEPETFEEKTEFIAMGAIGATIAIGVLYIIYQYRAEIIGLFKRKKA